MLTSGPALGQPVFRDAACCPCPPLDPDTTLPAMECTGRCSGRRCSVLTPRPAGHLSDSVSSSASFPISVVLPSSNPSLLGAFLQNPSEPRSCAKQGTFPAGPGRSCSFPSTASFCLAGPRQTSGAPSVPLPHQRTAASPNVPGAFPRGPNGARLPCQARYLPCRT